MIMIIAISLGVLWVLGLGCSSTFGGGIHILIVAAVLLAAFHVHQRRRERRAR